MMKRIGVFLLFFFIVQSVWADLMCDDAGVDYFAIYKPNTYTCNPGYYLPANTDGCQPCPVGCTCVGGTFDWDLDFFQGVSSCSISATIMNNMCADNFPGDLFAIYEPNTVTLNFDDGNGNTTTTTCEYGDTIVIPENIPTRTGYNFTGWVVRENNN